ncbi:Transcriptional regulatory protein moc3 [Colletotrichum higginsianum]|uniref:Transcriptional regulatory protein moc3 n=1 Tax=Colletotrichum higginsianum TaxID=80884 RepID=A0A4T0VL14_9PEZI|nr:Transcriptional regulatory protein moc3 [Colletotrichum higginsianum]
MSRSRSGCLTCKRRHRKCDETRPDCLQCLGQGVECGGYRTILRWGSGIASRGRFAGAPAPVDAVAVDAPKPPKRKRTTSAPDRTAGESESPGVSSEYSSPSSFLPTSRNHGIGTSASAHPGSSAAGPRPTDRTGLRPEPELPPSQTLSPGRTEQDRRLFEEFNETTVFLLYSGRRDDGFRDELRRLAQRSEALCSILLATHLYVSSPASPPPLFEEYYVRGLSLFRKQLESSDGTVNVGVMHAGLCICTLNLFQSAPWSIHLELMTTVYGLGGALHGSPVLADPDAQFSLEIMALMDMPTFVRGRSTLTLGIWSRVRQAQHLWQDDAGSPPAERWRRGGVELVSGLPRSLLDIFSTVEDASSEAAFLAWPGEVGEVPQVHLWEAYRLAGVLTGRRLRRRRRRRSTGGGGGIGGGGGGGATAEDVAPSPPEMVSIPPTDVLLCRLVAAVDALCDTRGRPEHAQSLAVNSLTYPYVAARLEVAALLRHPDWLRHLRRAADVCQPYGRTANALHIAEMLDEAWALRDDEYDIDEGSRRRNVEVALF